MNDLLKKCQCGNTMAAKAKMCLTCLQEDVERREGRYLIESGRVKRKRDKISSVIVTQEIA